MDTSPDPSTVPQKPAPTTDPRLVVHTYESDLALAMNTTEAGVIQELLETSREREAADAEKKVVSRQRGWYTTAGIILITLALGAALYGLYYYNHLTVRVVSPVSVGVFQSTDSVDTSVTDIDHAITRLTTQDSLPEHKPLLVPLVTDSKTLIPLDTMHALTYVGIHASEPLLASISLARLGVMNTGASVSPFLIFSVPDAEIASKELFIAEPDLLNMVARSLAIDLTDQTREVGATFNSTYMYNLPVRTLTATNLDTNQQMILLYYGYATDHTIVVATNPSVLKAIYDTIIKQR